MNVHAMAVSVLPLVSIYRTICISIAIVAPPDAYPGITYIYKS